MELLIQKFTPFLRKYWFPLSLGFFGMILIIYGLISSFTAGSDDNQGEIIFTSAEGSTAQPEDKLPKEIIVDVAGAVINPGVYKLPEGSRVDDALIKAGGMSADADRELVAKQINLAAKLTDGAKVYLPTVGEVGVSQISTLSSSGDLSNLININTASANELEALPGIGEVTAQKIIDNRPYSSVDELMSKKAVNKSVFEKIKDLVSVY